MKDTQTAFLERLVGQPVLITFLDGKQLTGTLKACDTYILLVQVARDDVVVELLMYKHAIRYIATVGE